MDHPTGGQCASELASKGVAGDANPIGLPQQRQGHLGAESSDYLTTIPDIRQAGRGKLVNRYHRTQP
jgi:hypothetical protein